MSFSSVKNRSLAVVGLGYVGLPLAVEFAKHRKVYGFDISEQRINELNQGVDNTGEVSYATLTGSENLICTNQISDLADCDFYIVAVPTPVSANNVPDLEPLFGACRSLSGVLADGDIVVFESTVYPGATEEDCAKLIEQISGLKSFSADDLGGSQAKGYFYLGYSPERVNPGDPSRKITDIVKVVSACDAETLDIVDKVYSSIIAAGTYRASSIRVAEAAKVIENIQRDVNIALVNELAMLFHKMDISTKDVLDAAKNEVEFFEFYTWLGWWSLYRCGPVLSNAQKLNNLILSQK